MYGWRGRIGLIVPSNNTVLESEFADYLPEGVSLHTTRTSGGKASEDDIAQQTEALDRCSTQLAEADVDVIVFGSTAGSFVHEDGAAGIERDIQEKTGIPAVATAASVVRACHFLGLESLTISTPYPNALNQREVEFFEDEFEVVDIDGLGLDSALQIGEKFPEEAFQAAKTVDTSDADGLFISCTAYRTFSILEQLEQDLCIPVISSNQVTLWDALRTIQIDPTTVELASLLSNSNYDE